MSHDDSYIMLDRYCIAHILCVIWICYYVLFKLQVKSAYLGLQNNKKRTHLLYNNNDVLVC